MKKEVLEIHLDRLEDDCQEQPSLTMEHGQNLVEATKRVKECKNALKIIEANTRMRVLRVPEQFGIKDKPTEKTIESVILISGEYQEALKELHAAEYEEDSLDKLFKAIGERKVMIETLSRLHGQLYFSRPVLEAQAQVKQATRVRTMRDGGDEDERKPRSK